MAGVMAEYYLQMPTSLKTSKIHHQIEQHQTESNLMSLSIHSTSSTSSNPHSKKRRRLTSIQLVDPEPEPYTHSSPTSVMLSQFQNDVISDLSSSANTNILLSWSCDSEPQQDNAQIGIDSHNAINICNMCGTHCNGNMSSCISNTRTATSSLENNTTTSTTTTLDKEKKEELALPLTPRSRTRTSSNFSIASNAGGDSSYSSNMDSYFLHCIDECLDVIVDYFDINDN